MFWIRDQGDGEMEMIVSGSSISGIAYVRDSFTLLGKVTFSQTFGISIKVRIVVNEFVVSTQLINGCASTLALKEFHDCSVSRCEHRRATRGGNINRVMNPPL